MEESFKCDDGRILVLSPVNRAGDLAEIRWFAQYAGYLELVERKEHFAPAQIDRVFDYCSRQKITSDVVEQSIGSPAGASFFFWLSVRQRQPEVTLEQCKGFLRFTDFADVIDKIKTISGFNTVKKTTEITAIETSSTLEKSTESTPKNLDGHQPK